MIVGLAANDVFAVGPSSSLMHFDGSYWSPVRMTTPKNFTAVWGTDDWFYIGADDGTVTRLLRSVAW